MKWNIFAESLFGKHGNLSCTCEGMDDATKEEIQRLADEYGLGRDVDAIRQVPKVPNRRYNGKPPEKCGR